jgi:dihydroorotate dehydrogenase
VYRQALRPLLFRLDAEDAHHLSLNLLQAASRLPLWPALARGVTLPGAVQPQLSQTLWGRTFASPVGLAAGLDKNGVAVPAFGAMGFGFLEVGTVTPLAQPGNPRPRLFRLPSDGALINRMGFNNAGAEALRGRLSTGKRPVPVWVNIGKNKDTPNEEAVQDYLKCVRALHAVADGFVINVSSPNTPGLRALQEAAGLGALVRAVQQEVEAQSGGEAGRVRAGRRPPPVLVKLAPDLHPADFEASVNAVQEAGADGLIISNTTLSRAGLTHTHAAEAGGLSGIPLALRSTALIADAYRQTRGRLPIVGVGGILTPESAYAKIRAGASLIELYTGLIYEGPLLPARLNRTLAQLLQRDGFKTVAEAVGAGE